MTDERDHPEVDGPTAMEPVAGRLGDSPDEPVDPAEIEGLASYGPTTIEPIGRFTDAPRPDSWPFEEFEPPPRSAPVATHSPAYYVSLGASVVLVVGLVALAAVLAVLRPQQVIAGTAAGPVIPEITTSSGLPTTTSQAGPLTVIATHPLSSSTTRMSDTTCALPRFDPADDRQAIFYAAAKDCADVAWREVLLEIGLDDVPVEVVTVTGATQAGSCGDLAPTSAATQCDGTVYLTPAHLRDTEQNGRYPGRYLGVFLREYSRALQYTTGLEQAVGTVPNGSPEDLDTRLAQQATCLAGVVAGAMAGRGAIDSNITGEIRARLSAVDAPPDAQAWLDKGFRQRTPAACNTWN